MTLFRKILRFLVRLIRWTFRQFNLKMGLLGGIGAGMIVYFINYKYGFLIATHAFVKQFFFTLCMGGITTGMCEKIAKTVRIQWLSIALATLIPTGIAFAGVYSVHFYLNTPKPLASTLWQAYGNFFGFLIVGMAYHRNLEVKYKWLRMLISSKRRVENQLKND